MLLQKHLKVKLIINKRVVIDKLKICNSFLSRASGLMFSTLKDKNGAVLVFNKESIVSIHTLFVFSPIDVFWLDTKFKLVEIRRSIKPFTFIIIPKNKAKYVVETKPNLLKGISVGTKILLRKG